MHLLHMVPVFCRTPGYSRVGPNAFLRANGGGSMDNIEGMLGPSPAIHAIFGLIHKMAKTDLPVLVTGETGTGKDVTAHAIHARSLRGQGPFVPINCGAIPETLLESELFGHERDAFTGAVHQKKGKLEAAAGGTVFLNELILEDLPIK